MPQHKELPETLIEQPKNDLPERALLAAMLDEAITTIRLREHHLARNARAWIMSKEKYPFSFDSQVGPPPNKPLAAHP